MEELSAMEAYVSSNLSFPATSGIMLANEMSAPSQGITLHYPSGDGSNDTVAANGFSGESNVENGKGTYSFWACFFPLHNLFLLFNPH